MDETTLTEYADALFGGEDDLLRAMRREAGDEGLPTIQVPTELARLLSLLVVQTQARRILEIGTLFGYSAVVMARALPADGRITTLEVNPKHAAISRRNLERAGVAEKVTVVEGPALESLERLGAQEFDLVFIDADKESYPAYLHAALRLTHPGSVIVADNVWRGGVVARPGADQATAVAMSRFNRALAEESRLVSTIIPTRNGGDGATLSVVR